MRKQRRKFTKSQYRAYQRRSCAAIRAKAKEKRANKAREDAVDGTDIQEVEVNNKHSECIIIKEFQDLDMVCEPEEIELTVGSGDDTTNNITESDNDAPCEISSNEELWVVRRQLCRGCHSDGAFWSLQTTTEGDTYEHLMQTYFNIQLCPVSEDEHALSAICALCAARLREARAFSAQAHAAEERFTRLYKQNYVRVFVNDELIKKEETFDEADQSQIANDVQPDTANSNLADHSQIANDVQPDTANSNLDDLKAPIEEKLQVRCDEPSPKCKELSNLEFSDFERVGKLFKCPYCDKMYGKRYIKRHVTAQHSIPTKNSKKQAKYKLLPSDYERVDNLYKCTRCERRYKQSTAVLYHVMYKHLKIPRFTCPTCDKTFHWISSFNKHKLEEHSIDDRFKCNACDWFTHRQSDLAKHKNDFHMLGVKLSCKDCSYSSYCHRSMKKHAIKHSTVKEHHCKFCKKSFLRKHNLNFHERIHTGDKRKVCNVCGEAFVQRASLKYHMTKHHPEVRD